MGKRSGWRDLDKLGHAEELHCPEKGTTVSLTGLDIGRVVGPFVGWSEGFKVG